MHGYRHISQVIADKETVPVSAGVQQLVKPGSTLVPARSAPRRPDDLEASSEVESGTLRFRNFPFPIERQGTVPRTQFDLPSAERALRG